MANAGLFGKVYFPRLAVPVSIVISQLCTFGLQLMLFLAFLAYYAWNGATVEPSSVILLTPFLILLMAGLGLGAGIIFSALTTKYRDLRFLLTFGVQLLIYATPVIYPLSAIPGKYRFFILANPMTPIIETFRYGFLGSGTFDPLHLAYSTAFTAIILLIGILLFSRIERTFMDTV